MSLNATPSGERLHIAVFGRRNAGKSSIINGLTGQALSIVSDIPGTTTDPVYKAMELLPLGPVMLIDTPGIDDFGPLGQLRVEKTKEILNKADIALLVVYSESGLSEEDETLLELFKKQNQPYLILFNKRDLSDSISQMPEGTLAVSAHDPADMNKVKEALGQLAGQAKTDRRLLKDDLKAGDLVVLVIPIDSAAPKGRLILPQQQVLREILDANALGIVTTPEGLKQALKVSSQKPNLVITDSQVFGPVSKILPPEILMTSFSILFARYKGDLALNLEGIQAMEALEDGDRILIGEGCSHHRQCDDIGTVKIPRWLTSYTGKNLQFDFTSGREFPQDLSPYQMVIHCGGCTLNSREMQHRQQTAEHQSIPMANYGMVIAQVHGILKRSLEPFPELLSLLHS